jgi:hypothetical protein
MRIQDGWRPIRFWGAEGWELGEWPDVAVFWRELRDFEIMVVDDEAASYDRFSTETGRIAHTDRIARRHARANDKPWANDPRFSGPAPC